MGKYKRVPGSRPYQDYSPETLKNCLDLIRKRNISIASASRQFKIPRRTLCRKLKDNDSNELKKCGRPTVFTKDKEESFAQHLLLLVEFDLPITRDDLRICIKNYLTESGREIPEFKNNIPGKDWVCNFLTHHPDIRTRTAENIKLSRAAVTEEILTKYIQNLTKTMEGVPTANIYNFDETNLTDNPGQKKVLTGVFFFFFFFKEFQIAMNQFFICF